MSSEVPAELKEKVQRILAANWKTEIDGSGVGDFFIRGESTGCHVMLEGGWGPKKESNLVHLLSFVLWDVPITEELLTFIAEGGTRYFGSLSLQRNEDGTGDLILTHTLLGDFLDSEELNIALASVFFGADFLDDELQGRFGGRRTIDPID